MLLAKAGVPFAIIPTALCRIAIDAGAAPNIFGSMVRATPFRFAALLVTVSQYYATIPAVCDACGFVFHLHEIPFALFMGRAVSQFARVANTRIAEPIAWRCRVATESVH